MSVQSYNGSLGDFRYDDEVFRLCLDNDHEYLHYIGKETAGEKIKVPEGITDGSSMFENTDIVSQPELPDSLRSMRYMFAGCQNLQESGKIPDNVEDCHSAYSYCTHMKSAPVMPDSVICADYMYDGCRELRNIPNISDNLKTADCMLANCDNLEQMPLIPDSVEHQDSIFLNCDKLFDNNPDDDYEDLFSDLIVETTESFKTSDFIRNYQKSYDEKCKGIGKSKIRREYDPELESVSEAQYELI